MSGVTTRRMKYQLMNTVSQQRKTKSVTQEELADKVNVSRQTIIAIEKGNYTPSVLLALKISHYFRTQVEDIFTLQYEK